MVFTFLECSCLELLLIGACMFKSDDELECILVAFFFILYISSCSSSLSCTPLISFLSFLTILIALFYLLSSSSLSLISCSFFLLTALPYVNDSHNSFAFSINCMYFSCFVHSTLDYFSFDNSCSYDTKGYIKM